jgi:hypothetical protein
LGTNPIAGTLMRMSGTWTDVGGTLIDPTAVTLLVRDPTTGPLTTLTLAGGGVVKDSTGRYHATVDTTAKPGHWVFEFYSTGAIADQTGEFEIDPSPLH